MLENSSARPLDIPSYCLITWREAANVENVEVLNLRLSCGEVVLPVFEDKARVGMTLWLEALDEGWQVEKLSVEELASWLRGPCTSIERVLLNPFSAGTAEEAGVKREAFLRNLAGERAHSIERGGHGRESAECRERRKGAAMMEVELLDNEVSEDGTVIEVLRIIDVKDATEPARLLIREWMDERHYRDFEVAAKT